MLTSKELRQNCTEKCICHYCEFDDHTTGDCKVDGNCLVAHNEELCPITKNKCKNYKFISQEKKIKSYDCPDCLMEQTTYDPCLNCRRTYLKEDY